MSVTKEKSTGLAELVEGKMAEHDISIKDLAEKMDITYEHVRRIVRGEGIPSKFVLKLLADTLKIPYKEAERIATNDKILNKYGSIPAELSGKKPTLEPIDRVWDKLNDQQQSTLIDMAQAFVRRNRLVKSA